MKPGIKEEIVSQREFQGTAITDRNGSIVCVVKKENVIRDIACFVCGTNYRVYKQKTAKALLRHTHVHAVKYTTSSILC